MDPGQWWGRAAQQGEEVLGPKGHVRAPPGWLKVLVCLLLLPIREFLLSQAGWKLSTLAPLASLQPMGYKGFELLQTG